MSNHTHAKFSDKVKRFLQREKPKKSIFSTVAFDDKLLNVSGEVQRKPWKDLSMWRVGWFYFCNKISLIIENKGNSSVDTDASNKPLV